MSLSSSSEQVGSFYDGLGVSLKSLLMRDKVLDDVIRTIALAENHKYIHPVMRLAVERWLSSLGLQLKWSCDFEFAEKKHYKKAQAQDVQAMDMGIDS